MSFKLFSNDKIIIVLGGGGPMQSESLCYNTSIFLFLLSKHTIDLLIGSYIKIYCISGHNPTKYWYTYIVDKYSPSSQLAIRS